MVVAFTAMLDSEGSRRVQGLGFMEEGSQGLGLHDCMRESCKSLRFLYLLYQHDYNVS